MTADAFRIVLHPDPVLATRCPEADPASPETADLVRKLSAGMAAAGGIGLAAPQIGVLSRVVVVGVPDGSGGLRPQPMVNPQIVWKSSVSTPLAEGCLSIPRRRFLVTRPNEVQVEYTDLSGKRLVVLGRGLVAKCMQHEIDHLDGILISDIGQEVQAERP